MGASNLQVKPILGDRLCLFTRRNHRGVFKELFSHADNPLVEYELEEFALFRGLGAAGLSRDGKVITRPEDL
jgi:hypothetical protein